MWLPLGTRFCLCSDQQKQQYVIEDYGSALVGKETIDEFRQLVAAAHRDGS